MTNKSSDPYRILPPHTDQELAALEASIAENGLEDPIIMDAEHNIIDGHARRDICETLGIDWHVGADVRVGLTNDQKRALAITLNLARRSAVPTAQQRREYAEALLRAQPESSDARIAAVVGMSRSSIQRLRTELTQSGKLTPPLRTVGVDGKSRVVSSDKRKSRFQVKSRAEYEKLAPAANNLKAPPKTTNGIIQKPHRMPATLRREEALARVEVSGAQQLPPSIYVRCCDFRQLEIEPHSVDLICTDVVWAKDAQGDWAELAKLAKKWLKPEGLFATFIGQMHKYDFYRVIAPFLHPVWEFAFIFSGTTRNIVRSVIEGWRPITIYAPAPSVDFHFVKDTLTSRGSEKDYHDWQQPLPVVKELIHRLVPREGSPVVVDPQLGTGTTAVACCQLGIRFIGGDIDPKMVEIARYRIATEGVVGDVG